MRTVDTLELVSQAVARLPRYDPLETGYVLYLTSTYGLISVDVFKGKSNELYLPMDKVARRAWSLAAFGVTLIHTHPGYSPYESPQDIQFSAVANSYLRKCDLMLMGDFILTQDGMKSYARYH
jgi:DNA repair protein RadC